MLLSESYRRRLRELSGIIRESSLNEVDDVFKSITNIPDFDKLRDGKYDELPPKYSNMSAEVVNMSPEQYFNYCAKIQGTTYEQQLSYLRKEVVDKLIGLMDGGVKIDMPYLNFVKGGASQEGRHRAKAAMDLGIKSIPVLVINSKERGEGGNTLSSKIGVWDDLSFDGYNYRVTYNIKDWKGVDSLLSSIRRGYDVYLLDDIFDTYVYRRLHQNLLSVVNEIDTPYNIMSEYVSNGLDETLFLEYLPDEYKSRLNINWDDYTDEEYENYKKVLSEVKPKLVKLALLFILMNNDSEMSSVINVDNSNDTASLVINRDINVDGDYNSGKEMLLDYQIYDDLDLYSVEGDDYYKMGEKFIKTYFDKV